MISEREPSAAGSSRIWRVGSREVILDHPIVMGILNVTPDSFSDGGNFFSHKKAVVHAAEMIGDGADIIDVGGESTRPGATIVEDAEEIRRVVPVIAEIRQRFPDTKISIDTTKSCVALAAIEAGADIVNDVSAFRLDSKMPEVVRDSGSGVILMHSRGGIEDLASYAHARYEGDAVVTIVEELSASAGLALSEGIARDRIVLDPGFGFSKVSATSMELLSRLNELIAIGFPVLIGVSRKRFVTELMLRLDDRMVGDIKSASPSIEDRDVGTEALNVVALLKGAAIFRVHNVRMARRALDAVWPIIATRTVYAG